MNAEPSGAHLVRLRNATVEGGRQNKNEAHAGGENAEAGIARLRRRAWADAARARSRAMRARSTFASETKPRPISADTRANSRSASACSANASRAFEPAAPSCASRAATLALASASVRASSGPGSAGRTRPSRVARAATRSPGFSGTRSSSPVIGVLAMRSERRPLWREPLRSNPLGYYLASPRRSPSNWRRCTGVRCKRFSGPPRSSLRSC